MTSIPPPCFVASPLTSTTLSRDKKEIDEWRKSASITLSEFNSSRSGFSASGQVPESVPPPLLTFEECSFLPRFMHDSFQRQSFTKPTPIQSQSWSIIFEQKDMVAVAKTGSGKTLGFMVPGIIHIINQYRNGKQEKYYTNANYMSPIALVLAPTRELATQIEAETKKVLEAGAAICSTSQENLEITVASAYGGVHKGTQLGQIKQRQYGNGGRGYQRGNYHRMANHMVPILVACPGRLQDYLQSGDIHVGNVSYFVLDEADRMLDMGFEPQINAIVGYLRENSDESFNRQTVMFSATWPREVQSMAARFLRPQFLQLNVGDKDLSANTDVTQVLRYAQPYEKNQKVLEALLNPQKAMDLKNFDNKKLNNVLIFCGKKYSVEELCTELKRQLDDVIRGSGNQGSESQNPLGFCRYNCYTIHGDKSQSQRDWVLDRFRQCCSNSRANEINVLIATDVAQRGLDISNLDLVVNYDFPNTLEDYVHRIGRTGRAGTKGVALSFLSRTEYKIIPPLCALLSKAKQDVPEDLFRINPSARNFASGHNLNDSFRQAYLGRGGSRGRGSSFGASRGGFDRNSWGQRQSFGQSHGYDRPRDFKSYGDRDRYGSSMSHYKRDRDSEQARSYGNSYNSGASQHSREPYSGNRFENDSFSRRERSPPRKLSERSYESEKSRQY